MQMGVRDNRFLYHSIARREQNQRPVGAMGGMVILVVDVVASG